MGTGHQQGPCRAAAKNSRGRQISLPESNTTDVHPQPPERDVTTGGGPSAGRGPGTAQMLKGVWPSPFSGDLSLSGARCRGLQGGEDTSVWAGRQGPAPAVSSRGPLFLHHVCSLPTLPGSMVSDCPSLLSWQRSPQMAEGQDRLRWPLMAGVGQMSSLHQHRAGSGSRWHLDPDLASQFSPWMSPTENQGWAYLQRNLRAQRLATVMQRLEGPDPSRVELGGAGGSFHIMWQWLSSS